MNQFVKLEDFYKSLKDIKLINNSVDEKRELVKKYVSNFNANIQNLRIDENIKKQNKEISNLLEETINLIKLVSNDWLKNFFDRNEEALKKRGLHRISPHGLRHSQATLLFELGVDPKNAQYRLRHKNLKTTMDIYTHLSEQQKQAPTQQLSAFSATVPTSVPTFSEATKKQR